MWKGRLFSMKLKVIEETSSGLNTRFVNEDSGRTVSLQHVLDQLNKGNPNYKNYEKVINPNGTIYVRSKADGKSGNNIQ